jgi:predicted MFS family arabinose efflux permease
MGGKFEMSISVRQRFKTATSAWSPYLIMLAVTVFLERLGQGLLGGASTNFYVNVLGLSGKEVLWLAGLREIPGLALMGIAALMMHWPLSRRAALALLVMGAGFGLYATVHSFTALIAVAIVASLGFHVWMPLESSLGMALTTRERSGRVLGFLASMGSLATIVGMGLTALLATTLSLRTFYIIGAVFILTGALLVSRIPADIGKRMETERRMILKRRYWLYYVLIFFEGSRMQVFGAFGTLILVQDYGLDARRISLLLVVSGIMNFLLTPRLGHLLDILGERVMLAGSYVLLALCFAGYATVHNVWFLGAMLIAINLLVTLRIGLSTYVRRISPPEELTPTLSAGVSINHITSVSMSLVAGSLLSIVGYEWLCWGAAALIMISVPFALAIKVVAPPALEVQPSGAE